MTSISEPIKFGEAGAALRELRKAIIGEPISDFNDFDLFMQVNLELPVTQKFQSFNEFTRGLRAASEDPTYGARMVNKIEGIARALTRLRPWLRGGVLTRDEYPTLAPRLSDHHLRSRESLSLSETENSQFHKVLGSLNQAHEQIIFNFEPAEVGPPEDPRARRLRRALIVNLGLIDLSLVPDKLTDIEPNIGVHCGYVFVVPDRETAEKLWLGILVELGTALHEQLRDAGIKGVRKEAVLQIAQKKLELLCQGLYPDCPLGIIRSSDARTIGLAPLNVFHVSTQYCWAPIVVISQGEDEDTRSGYLLFATVDSGVAQMSDSALFLWQTHVLHPLLESLRESTSSTLPIRRVGWTSELTERNHERIMIRFLQAMQGVS